MHVFVVEEGKTRLLDTPACCEELAGFESWRTTVWGSAAARALGARFFPVLDGGDLTVMPAQVPDFVVETKLLRANLDKLVPGTDPSHDHQWYVEAISWRLANIQIAAGRALGAGGGVIVW
ncbi:hypothetical protein C791_3396 [Amycolatopsis azurea DSM 43854]|uniref:Uncharacterized protein n=1 Tax=Amycolatopsis azurea DSM 43854 TaxID=1238180 RepID=M2QL15_9PSEU|nr:hypothetical protein C791_3396 [Amycolatopsis azurea DSM 43854]